MVFHELQTELNEIIKCKQDFFYFVKRYVKLDVPGADDEFNYHIGQELLIRSILKYHYIICLKSRQIGITTIVRAFCVWLTIFNKNYNVGVISKLSEDATAFIRKCINIIENLPDFLRPNFAKKTEQQYILDNGSMAMAAAVSASQPENTLRSNPITFLIIDEAAFIRKIDVALSGLLPTTITTHRAAKMKNLVYGILVISTPNKTKGVGSWFYKAYKDALLNNSVNGDVDDGSFRAVRLHWKDIGGIFDETWYEMQKKVLNYNAEMIAQEIDCTFLPAGRNSLILPDQAVILSKTQREPCKVVRVNGGNIYIFDKDLENEKDKKRFVIGVDTATSVGERSFSSIVAINYDTNEQVLEYVGKLSIYDFPEVIRKVCEILGENIFLIIERNTIGESIVEHFYRDPKYSNKLYYTIEKNKYGQIVKKLPGIETTGATKPLFLEALSVFLQENIHKIYGERLIMQLLESEVENGKIISYPCDLIMALSFIAYAKLNNLVKFEKNKENNYTKNDMLDNLSTEEIIKYLNSENETLKDLYIKQILHGKK